MRRIVLPLLAVAAFSLPEETSAVTVTVGPTSYSVTTYRLSDNYSL
jgi:hypothetical protein